MARSLAHQSDRRRCPTCGRFYSDSGLPSDYPNREAFALDIHRDVWNCRETSEGPAPDADPS